MRTGRERPVQCQMCINYLDAVLHNGEIELLLMQVRIGFDSHGVSKVCFNLFHDFALGRSQRLCHMR